MDDRLPWPNMAPESWHFERTLRHFYLYESCCQNNALEPRDKVRLQELFGLSQEGADLIESTIDSHFSRVRGCVMCSMYGACALSVIGILIVLGGGEDDFKCGPSNCIVGIIVSLAPWAWFVVFAVAYACCIVEAKNEKASSALNLAFQSQGLHFRLSQTTHHSYSYNYDHSSYTRHVLEVSGRTR